MKQREFPNFWVTWLVGLMAGEESCRWKSWAKAHYYTDKLSRGFDLAHWEKEHTTLLDTLDTKYRKTSVKVLREDQTKWVLKGTYAQVAGKMDLVCCEPDLIIDAKSGKEKASHVLQMHVYQIAVEKGCVLGIGGKVPGLLWYANQAKPVHVPPPDQAFKDKFFNLVRELATYEPPEATPSQRECRYCDIANCLWREESTERVTTVDEF
jgi:hypothetical protein